MTDSPGAWEFALSLLLRPKRAAQALAIAIFISYLLVSAAFHAWKPFDFPPLPGGAQMEAPPGGLLFWVKVQAWQIPLAALGILLTAWFARLLSGEGIPRRIAAATGCALLPLLLIAASRMLHMPKWIFAICWLVLLAALIPGLKRVEAGSWRPLAAWLLGANVVAVAAVPFAVGLVVLKAASAYQAFEYVTAFWMLALTTYGVGRLFAVATARAFCAVFLSVICEVLFLFGFYFLGFLPKAVLSVLLLTL